MGGTMREEELFGLLKESAVRRWGQERAEALEPTLQDICRALARLGQYPLDLEEEPAFFS